MGIIARRGVSVRNGAWDEQLGPLCEDPEERSGAFVAQNTNIMSDYTYMLDHMGNVAALVDSASGTARQQVFDAFGNNIEGYATFQCVADQDSADLMVHPVDPPCPLPAAQPIERMQTGGLNWRGGEGSITDRVAEDMRNSEAECGQPAFGCGEWPILCCTDRDPTLEDVRWSAYTRPSTGLIYMQNRFYDPQTGRFTQADPVPYGLEIMRGQNNRWVYCGNDPVNHSDPSGLGPLGLFAMFLLGVGRIAGGNVGTALVAIANVLAMIDAGDFGAANAACLLKLLKMQLKVALKALIRSLGNAALALSRLVATALQMLGGAGIAALGGIAITLAAGALVLFGGYSVVMYYQFHVWQALQSTAYSDARGKKRGRHQRWPAWESEYALGGWRAPQHRNKEECHIRFVNAHPAGGINLSSLGLC